ncbi:MAG: winged helix-turn-helix domain-containing protein [Candidatus Aminicenantes bacterium]
MKNKIGETAGKIWKVLKKKGEVNVAQLPKLLNEKSAVVYQALGWLAREDKIDYQIKAAKTFVSLAKGEKNK